MSIEEYFAGSNAVIAGLCIGFLFAVAAKAETPLLRVSVVLVLFVEGLRNGLSYYLRTGNSSDFGAETGAEIFSVLNTLLIIGILLATLATLRLERSATPQVRERLDEITGKQDEDLTQQNRIEGKLDDLETKIEGDERRATNDENESDRRST